jgi:hypothetical protein
MVKNRNITAERVQEIPVLFIIAAVEQVGSSSNTCDLCTGGGRVLSTARTLTVPADANLGYPLSL